MAEPFVSVVNLGCRVNRVESDRISVDLAQAGFALVDPDEADLIVINTCAVTGEAEAKTRKAVRHALGRDRSPIVVVTGCAANLHPDALASLSPRVVVEPSKVDVCQRVEQALGYRNEAAPASGVHASALEATSDLGRSRLGVKVQDGCNNRCTYCIVWKARGPERSVRVETVLDEIRGIAAAGIPEVVLTGVNLGAYDGESADGSHIEIDELLSRILRGTSIPYVRLSSLEPQDVSNRLVEQMAAHPSRVAPFLHLPLQSGCTSTLERMGRPYTAEDFLTLTRRIRRILPQASISCDIIVGFPGETDREFAQSLELCREVGFSRMHVFRYSARPGTVAAEMPDQVQPEVMAERSRRMRDLADELRLADARLRVGTTELAVLEYGNRGTLGSFHRVLVEDAPQIDGPQILRVGIIGIDEDGLLRARVDSVRQQ